MTGNRFKIVCGDTLTQYALYRLAFRGALVLTLALYGKPAAGLQTPASAAADYAAGQRAFAARDCQVAVRMLARAVAEGGGLGEPRQGDALWMQAQCLANLARYPEAESVLRQAPRSAKTLYLLGLVLQRENQPGQSLKVFTQAANLARPNGEQLRTVALDYVLLSDYPDAIHWLSRALEADPNNAEAWYDLGRAHMHDEKFTEAALELRRSLALDSKSPKAWDNLGICLEAQNRPEEAGNAYEQAVSAARASAHPGEHSGEQPFLDYGKLLNTRNEFERASALLERASQIAPRNSSAFAELARAYVGLHKIAAAQTAMERAVELDPKNSRLHFQLARIYRSAGLAAKANAEFKLSSEMYGQHSAE